MQTSTQTDSALGLSMESQQQTHRATCWRPSESDSANARLAFTIAQQLQIESNRRLAAAAAVTASGTSTSTSSREHSTLENRAPAARPPLPRMGTRVPVAQVSTLTTAAPRLLKLLPVAQPIADPAAPHAAPEPRALPLRRSATANLCPNQCTATAPSATQPQMTATCDALQDYQPELEADAQLDALEWVLRRRADGSHYVSKRSVHRSHTAFALSKAAQQRRELLSRRAAEVTAERSMLTTEASEEEANGAKADRYFVNRATRREHLDARHASRGRRDFLRRLRSATGRSESCKQAAQPLSQMADSFVALALL